MTRLKRAWIALYLVAFANATLITAAWPRPPKLTAWAVLLIGAGAVVIAYREDPASFRARVDKRVAARLILVPVIVVAVLIVLAKTHLL